MMKYMYLSGFPKIFLTMRGLHLNEFDELVREVEPRYPAAEPKRVSRPDRQRDVGGGDHPDLSPRDQILLTVMWLRQ